jgi:hypothetical protein
LADVLIHKHRATAIRNLKISSVAIASTFIFMLGTSLTGSFATSDDDKYGLEHAHWQTWQFYGGATDLFGEFFGTDVQTGCQLIVQLTVLNRVACPHDR